jgi:hypothetical protein
MEAVRALLSYARAMATMYVPRQSIWLDGLPASQPARTPLDRQADRQTGRQTDRQTDRQADRQTDRQEDGKIEQQEEDKESWKSHGLENTQVSFRRSFYPTREGSHSSIYATS